MWDVSPDSELFVCPAAPIVSRLQGSGWKFTHCYIIATQKIKTHCLVHSLCGPATCMATKLSTYMRFAFLIEKKLVHYSYSPKISILPHLCTESWMCVFRFLDWVLMLRSSCPLVNKTFGTWRHSLTLNICTLVELVKKKCTITVGVD